jgi:hypothetical protein
MSLTQQRFLTIVFLLALVAALIVAFAMFEGGHLMNSIWHSIVVTPDVQSGRH